MGKIKTKLIKTENRKFSSVDFWTMGKIKTKLIKRTAKKLIEKGVEFDEDFTKNKRIPGNTMPSKKIRNQIAGYLSRLKKFEAKKKAELAVK